MADATVPQHRSIRPGRDAHLTITTSGRFEVELFGIQTRHDTRLALVERRYVDSPELAAAMVRWWLDDGPEPAEIRGDS